MNEDLEPEIKHKKLITVISIVVPLVVAALFGIKIPNVGPFHNLPPIYATINGITALTLILAIVAIKNKRRFLHEVLMKSAMLMTFSFLVMYIIYHMTSDSTPYGGDYRALYFIILISHIILSILVLPLVLITYSRALSKAFVKHKKIARIAFPIWLYVAITGVIVYIMIAPFYTN